MTLVGRQRDSNIMGPARGGTVRHVRQLVLVLPDVILIISIYYLLYFSS